MQNIITVSHINLLHLIIQCYQIAWPTFQHRYTNYYIHLSGLSDQIIYMARALFTW